jgi:S1-C subfamily serine protease
MVAGAATCSLRACLECLPSPFGRGVGGEGCVAKMSKNSGIPASALTLTLSQRERGPICGHALSRARWVFCVLHFAFFILHFPLAASSVFASVAATIDQVQPKIVKIYGAGGLRGMEAYQTGVLISPDGYIVTAYSYVLDTDYITAVLSDGRRFQAALVGADPRLEIAVLRIEAAGLPCFDLAQAVTAPEGTRVLAFSNLFGVAVGDEPVSVQKGTIAAITKLDARRGVFETPYRGSVYVLDVTTNNPGAAGGALVTRRGRLVAVLGKELRNASNNTWLNYAVPIAELRQSVEDIRAGKFVVRREAETDKKPQRSLDLASLGIVLVPDVLDRTPPYVDHVRSGSPAAAAGVLPDDLVVLAGDHLIQSCKMLRADMEYIDYEDEIKLTVVRGRELRQFVLRSAAGRNPLRKDAP